jgi:pimeloyl-ACP methyl ester carboxylesterase
MLLPDRVRSVAVLSTFAPRNAEGLDWEANFCEWNLEEFKALREGDLALRRFLANAAAGMRKVATKDQLRVEFESDDMFCEADRAALAGPMLDYEFRCRAHIAQEVTDGWFDDDKAVYGDWGFDPRGIKVPVTIWFGKDDTIVPLAHGEWFERNLPSARSHFLKGEGHVSYFEQHYGEILEELRAMAR